MSMKSWLKKLQIRWELFRWWWGDKKRERACVKHLRNLLSMMEKNVAAVVKASATKQKGGISVGLDARTDVDMEEKRQAFLRSIEYCMQVHMEAFVQLMRAGKYESASHYVRMLTDLCIRAFAGTLFTGEKYDEYVRKFLEGGNYEDMRYKGKYLTGQKVKELMEAEYSFVAIAHKKGNDSTHFTNYYCPDFTANKSSLVKVSEALDMCHYVVAVFLNLVDILDRLQGNDKYQLRAKRKELEGLLQ